MIYSDTDSLSEREQIARNGVGKYGVEYIAPATKRYNCYSYTWYWQSIDNKYRIPDPSNYMIDGSYKRGRLQSFSQTAVDAGLESGQKIYYGTGNQKHSAIVQSPIKLGDAVGANYGISKFGSLGLYKHTLGNVPYPSDNVSSWK